MNIEQITVRITFTEDVLGSLPASKELLKNYIASRALSKELENEELEAIAVDEEKGMTVFPRNGDGLFLYDYHVKGFLKEAGNVLKKAIGIKALRSKIQDFVFVKPRKINIYRNGVPVKEHDEIQERPIRAMGPMGPRVALVASEVVIAPVSATVHITLLPGSEVKMDTVRECLDYGAFKGIGQRRNDSYGRFEWEELEA